MSKKHHASTEQTNVNVGNLSDVNGNISIAGGNITTHQTSSGVSTEDIKRLFEQLYTAIEANSKASPTDKADLKAQVEEIQFMVTEAVKRNKKVEESFLSRRFRNIASVAPDVLDIVVATLANPLAGLGVAARKIAEKAKEETKQG